MKRHILFLAVIILYSVSVSFAQNESLLKNQLDSLGNRTGFWLIHKPAELGEQSYKEYGYYQNNKKMGVWIKIDGLDRLMAQEMYRLGELDGKSRYYANGDLVLEATFKGLNPYGIYDTFMVTDIETELDFQVVVPSDRGSIKHGVWRYYNPETGIITKEELYQADSLIASYDYLAGRKSDAKYWDKVSKDMPHVKDPNGSKANRSKVRRSLVR